MLTNSELQVLPAVNDATTYFLELQTTTSGSTGSLYASPNLTFTPQNNTLGLNGTINLGGVMLPNNTAEKKFTAVITNSTVTIDVSAATIFEIALNTNITQFSLQNMQPVGRVSSFVIIMTADGTTRTVVWPSNFKWPQNIAPTITTTANKKDVFVFFTVDGGGTWQAFITGQNL
jgi:hypothetical protein